jgi:hypothetical protein
MKVGNFWDQTYTQIAADVTGTGFALATESQVQTLFADAGNPLTEPVYNNLASIMGGAWSGGAEPGGREIIWGDYLSTGLSTENWAWAYGPNIGGNGWNIENQSQPLSYAYADLGAWVVSGTSTSVPDGASSLLLLGLSTVALLSYRQKLRRMAIV